MYKERLTDYQQDRVEQGVIRNGRNVLTKKCATAGQINKPVINVTNMFYGSD